MKMEDKFKTNSMSKKLENRINLHRERLIFKNNYKNKTKQNKTKQNKTKQNKTKQNILQINYQLEQIFIQ